MELPASRVSPALEEKTMDTAIRTSAVFVSTTTGLRVFRDTDEVPADVRLRMSKMIKAGSCVTMVIADANGRERVRRLIAEGRHTPSQPQHGNSLDRPAQPPFTRYWPYLEAAIAALLAAAASALVFFK